MQELIDQFMSYARGAWRFRWYVHLVAWPLCIAGWYLVYELPDQYRASARVYVDTQSMLRPLLQGLAVQTDLSHEVSTLTRTLLSRPNMEKVARMTDIDLEATTPAEMEELLNRLQRSIELSGSGRENIYSISYSNKDPELAKLVVQSLLTLFVETSLGDSRKDSHVAQRFIDEQIKEYEARLYAAENVLKEFKRKNIGMMPEEGKEYYQRMQAAMVRLSNAQLELNEAINRRDELARQLRGEEPTFGIVSSSNLQAPTKSSFDKRIRTLETRLSDLLLKYTEKHPDVKALQQTIAQLKEKREEELAQLAKVMARPASSSLDVNPVYQQLKIAMGEAEATVAALQVRVDEYQAEVNRLRSLVNTIPEVEAEFKRLNRDYEVNKRNYEILLTRRESAKISEEAGQSSENVKLRIIDPPHVPLTPDSPNRPLLVTVVLVGSLLAGVVFALFMSQIRPAFDNARLITKELGVPVFGTVSRVWNGHAKLKRRAEIMVFGAGGLGLVSLYAVYMAYLLLSGGAA